MPNYRALNYDDVVPKTDYVSATQLAYIPAMLKKHSDVFSTSDQKDQRDGK